MELVFTGNGHAGSWACRGEQVGNALGALVHPGAGVDDFRAADCTVVVKRVPEARLAALRLSGKPWVFDCVDCYPQPECSDWPADAAIRWVQRFLDHLKPSGVIWPNQRMAHDIGFDGPSTVIYHHHRPNIRSNPIREHIRSVGYEGRAAYMESWRPQVEAECKKRGWEFVLNPPHLADVDIVLALRGGDWNGYAQKHWKSNVKLANAHGSGTPFVGSPECGYMETRSGAEYWAESLPGLRMAFDWLTDQGSREAVSDRFRQRAIPLESVAQQYRDFLSCVAKSC